MKKETIKSLKEENIINDPSEVGYGYDVLVERIVESKKKGK